MYSGALYIVPIVVFSVLYNINKFYEVNTAFLLDEMNNTVGTTGVSYRHKEMARSGAVFFSKVVSGLGSSPPGSETLDTMTFFVLHSITQFVRGVTGFLNYNARIYLCKANFIKLKLSGFVLCTSSFYLYSVYLTCRLLIITKF